MTSRSITIANMDTIVDVDANNIPTLVKAASLGTGTPSATTFLNGLRQWVPAGGGGTSLSVNGNTVNNPNLQNNAISLGIDWSVTLSNIVGAIRLSDVQSAAYQWAKNNVLVAGSITKTFDDTAQTITLTGTGSGSGTTVQGLSGAILLTSTNNSVAITVNGQNINFAASGSGPGSVPIPVINFTGSAAGGTGQTFTDPQLASYLSKNYISVTSNGSVLNSSNYTLAGTTLTITGYISPSAAVQVQPTAAGGSGGGGTGTVTSFGLSTALQQSFSVGTPTTTPTLSIANATSTSTQYLRADGQWAVPAGGSGNSWDIGGNTIGTINTPRIFGTLTPNPISMRVSNTEIARLTSGVTGKTFTTSGLPAATAQNLFTGYWSNTNGKYAGFVNALGTTLYIQQNGSSTFVSTVNLPQGFAEIDCGVQYSATQMVFGIAGSDLQSLWAQSASSLTLFTRQEFTITRSGSNDPLADIDFSPDGTKVAVILTTPSFVQTPQVYISTGYTTALTSLTFTGFNITGASDVSSIQWLDNISVMITDPTGGVYVVDTSNGNVTNPIATTRLSQSVESTLINGVIYIMTGTGLYIVDRTNPAAWVERLLYTFPITAYWGTEDLFSTSGGVFYYGTNLDSTNIYSINFGGQLQVTSGNLELGDGANIFTGISAGNANPPTSFTVGAAGQVLTSNGTVSYWNTPTLPTLAVIAYRLSAATAIVNQVDTTVFFDIQTRLAGDPSITYTNGAFTSTTGGIYLVSYQVAWSANATGVRAQYLQISGAGGRLMLEDRNASSDFSGVTSTGVWLAGSGETAQLKVWQNSGAAVNIGGAYAGYAAGYSVLISFVKIR